MLSLKVAPKLIEQVKLALKRNGFHSQQSLAKHLGIARATISNFFNGKSVDFMNFTEICQALRLCWTTCVGIDFDFNPPITRKNVRIQVRVGLVVTVVSWGDSVIRFSWFRLF